MNCCGGKRRLNSSSVTVTTGYFLMNAAAGTGQRLLGVWVIDAGLEAWVGNLNEAVCPGLCGAQLVVVHSNINALFGLPGLSVNCYE